MTDYPAEPLEEVDATMACWKVYGLDRDFQNRPDEGWHTAAALTAEPDVQLMITVGRIPDHIIAGVRGRWAHGIYMLNTIGNLYAGKTSEEVQQLLDEVDTEKVVARLKGPFNLWLTIEARRRVRIKILPDVRFLWLTNPGDLEELEQFATRMEPHLDAAFVGLLPKLSTSLTPTGLTTPKTLSYLIVPGRATFGLSRLEGKAHLAQLSASGWEEIDFEGLRVAVDGVARGDEPVNDLWRSASRWLLAAMGQQDDALRSFLFSFVGLEALTNKFGKEFEHEIVAGLGAELGFAIDHLTWPSPRDSDSPWRNLVYRFALMAVRLDRKNADADIDEFKELAAMRNGMAHGRSGPSDVDELPGHRSTALLRKYIGLAAGIERAERA